MVSFSALKFFAVVYGLLGVSVSRLTRGKRTSTPRKSLPTFAEKLLMRLRIETIKSFWTVPLSPQIAFISKKEWYNELVDNKVFLKNNLKHQNKRRGNKQ